MAKTGEPRVLMTASLAPPLATFSSCRDQQIECLPKWISNGGFRQSKSISVESAERRQTSDAVPWSRQNCYRPLRTAQRKRARHPEKDAEPSKHWAGCNSPWTSGHVRRRWLRL